MQALTDYSKQKRYDKYTLLKGSRFAYKNNVSDREHYIGILSDITGNDISSLTEKSDDELESISSFFNVDSCDYDNEEMLLAMQFTRAESVHEAFDMFRKNGTAFFRHYPNENDRLPENADKCFNIFFDRSASLRTEKLVQKLLERENNDLKKMSAKNPYSHL